MKQYKVTTGEKKQSHKKLIDIPIDTLPKLQKLAKKDRRDLKNYIEQQLIIIADKA